jgi:hypothetical protein
VAKRRVVEDPPVVRNEVLAPQGPAPTFIFVLGLEDVEKLAHGRVSGNLCEQAWASLRPQRMFDQAWDHIIACRCDYCRVKEEPC